MISREQLEACPRFAEHGLIEGCGLCDPSKMPKLDAEERATAQATAAVDEAAAVLARQQAIAAKVQANDAALQRLAQVHKVGIQPHDVIELPASVAVLVECLLGDESQPTRLEYEERVCQRFTQAIAGIESQVAEIESQRARATLLQGVQVKVPFPPQNGGRG